MKGKQRENYGSWMPAWILVLAIIFNLLFLGLAIFFALANTIITNFIVRISLMGVFLSLLGIFSILLIQVTVMRIEFRYDINKDTIATRIIEGLSDYIKLDNGKTLLDVGCGSGALSISCARKNPNAKITSIDRWGKEYPFYSKERCEINARCNNLNNITFLKGDATKLDFPDETFDAVISNFVYHNIPGDKKNHILETLRTLKKGGPFVIHDIYYKSIYGNMKKFADKLKEMGYEKVELIDTDNGKFLKRCIARFLFIRNSKILYGIK